MSVVSTTSICFYLPATSGSPPATRLSTCSAGPCPRAVIFTLFSFLLLCFLSRVGPETVLVSP